MNCPHCGKEISVAYIAADMGKKTSAAKTSANREKANLPPKPGKNERGRPRAYHLIGYVITATGKLSRNGLAKGLSAEEKKTILDAYHAGDLRRATVKAKRYWHNMKHDPELTADEEAGLAEILKKKGERK